jgi:hypothetical protein
MLARATHLPAMCFLTIFILNQSPKPSVNMIITLKRNNIKGHKNHVKLSF